MGETSIKSYGIVLYHTGRDGKKKYLIAQRRDTIEYIDFIRGKFVDINEVRPELMTPDERRKILKFRDNFECLWVDLMCKRFNPNDKKYEYAKQIFDNNIEHLNNVFGGHKIGYEHQTSWGFPKGRKNVGETNFVCALREFYEETKIQLWNIRGRDCSNALIINENYIGTDGKEYSTECYVCEIDEIPQIKIAWCHSPFFYRRQTISNEIKSIKWVTSEESKMYLDENKQSIIKYIDGLPPLDKPLNNCGLVNKS